MFQGTPHGGPESLRSQERDAGVQGVFPSAFTGFQKGQIMSLPHQSDAFEQAADRYWRRVARRRAEDAEDALASESGPALTLAGLLGFTSEWCKFCKRTMVQGVFANGYCDGPTICHSCKASRNARLTAGGDR